MLGVAAVGVLTALGILLVAGVLVMVGMLSAAVLAAILKKSLLAGIRTFVYFGFAIAGAVAGIFGFWAAGVLFHIQAAETTLLLAGLCSGLGGGVLSAYLSMRMVKYILKSMGTSQPGNH